MLMKTLVSRELAVAAILLALSGMALAQNLPAPPGPWWRADNMRKELGLTNDQATKIDQIWRERLPQAQQDKDRLDRLEGRLSRLIESDASETEVMLQAEHVESLRAAMNKDRILMLVRMRQVLTPDQRVKLTAIHSRWEADQRARQQQQQAQPPAPRNSPPPGQRGSTSPPPPHAAPPDQHQRPQ
jgi:Spy/CpxP family protein refolding chaperone